MPISPLPPDNTERWFYDYTVGGFQHALICRTPEHKSAGEVAEAIDIWLTTLDDYIATITTVGLRVALAGSNITNPQSTAGLAATYGTGSQGAIYAPVQTTFPSRSEDGHKGRVGIFGAANLSDTTYRILATEDSRINDAYLSLNSLSNAGFFVTISGEPGLYHPYANVKPNDHFVKELRG